MISVVSDRSEHNVCVTDHQTTFIMFRSSIQLQFIIITLLIKLIENDENQEKLNFLDYYYLAVMIFDLMCGVIEILWIWYFAHLMDTTFQKWFFGVIAIIMFLSAQIMYQFFGWLGYLYYDGSSVMME